MGDSNPADVVNAAFEFTVSSGSASPDPTLFELTGLFDPSLSLPSQLVPLLGTVECDVQNLLFQIQEAVSSGPPPICDFLP
jgi:hypothetical protein